MSLLTICQDAADLIGIARPATVAANSDATARQLGAWARFVLSDLADLYDWQQLVKEGTITFVAATQVYDVPADFGRFVHDSLWDRTQHEQQQMPVTPQEWAYLNGENLVTSMNRRARFIANQFNFFDTITAADASNVVKYEYITTLLALNSSTPVTNLTVDTYTSRINEKVVTQGVVAKYRVSKGLASQQAYQDFLRSAEKHTGFNNAPSAINQAPYTVTPLGVSVPDRGYA